MLEILKLWDVSQKYLIIYFPRSMCGRSERAWIQSVRHKERWTMSDVTWCSPSVHTLRTIEWLCQWCGLNWLLWCLFSCKSLIIRLKPLVFPSSSPPTFSILTLHSDEIFYFEFELQNQPWYFFVSEFIIFKLRSHAVTLKTLITFLTYFGNNTCIRAVYVRVVWVIFI